MKTVVNPVTGTVVDTQFMDAIIEHFAVTKQPRMQPFNSRGDSRYRPSVFQFIKPIHNLIEPDGTMLGSGDMVIFQLINIKIE